MQYGKNATVAVFPVTKYDVSYAVQASAHTSLERNLSFVSGAHGMTNSSSTTGFIIDLSWLNATSVEHDVTVSDTAIEAAIVYEGGATWQQVYETSNNTGYIAVGARDSDVGVGGFSTGGGIGFLAGAYGFAIDRMKAMEVVLVSGDIVMATKTNNYSDLFWALQGGNGQFGIVTKFWQEACIEPTDTQVGLWIIANDTIDECYDRIAEFFDDNDDPYSLVYYGVGYLSEEVAHGPPGIYTTIVAYWFNNPYNQSQRCFNETFEPLIEGLNVTYGNTYSVRITEAPELLNTYFPYGFRRGFWGPQTTNVTADYIKQGSQQMETYINELLARGESPESAIWVLQYMSPGLNGHLPSSDNDTAWPHSVAGHQTLFSPAWNYTSDDGLTEKTNELLSNMTYKHQATLEPKFLADYPNYMSPAASGHRIFGDNVQRLINVKEKYDPRCRLHQGMVFATSACIDGGWANLYAGSDDDDGISY